MRTSQLPDVGMKLPKIYTVFWRNAKNKSKHFETNDLHTAEVKAAINDGTIYIDNRYAAKKRLFCYLVRKALYGDKA